jgi:hypothetical protein
MMARMFCRTADEFEARVRRTNPDCSTGVVLVAHWASESGDEVGVTREPTVTEGLSLAVGPILSPDQPRTHDARAVVHNMREIVQDLADAHLTINGSLARGRRIDLEFVPVSELPDH